MFNKDNSVKSSSSANGSKSTKAGPKAAKSAQSFNLFEIIKTIVQFIAAQYFTILKLYQDKFQKKAQVGGLKAKTKKNFGQSRINNNENPNIGVNVDIGTIMSENYE